MKYTTLGRLVVSAFLIAAPLGIASAADMAVKAPKPAPEPPYSWNGFYIGAYAGAAWADQSTTTDPCLVGVACTLVGTYNGVPPAVYDMNPSFTGGVEVGVNWQPTPYTLLGLENKYGYMHVKGSYTMNPPPIGNSDTVASTTIGNWYDAFTARVGYVDGHVLFFLEGGGAVARVRTGVVDTGLPVTVNTTNNKTVGGWAAGGGLEYGITPNWSIKAEYLVLGINGTVNACSQVGGFPVGTIDCTNSRWTAVQTIDIGLNYRFSWR